MSRTAGAAELGTVGIAGRGRMGTMLARCFAATGAGVLIAGRRPPPPGGPAAADADGRIRHVAIGDVVSGADVLLLALPFSAAVELARARQLGPGRDRPLIDATNPCFDDATRVPPGLSGAAVLAGLLNDWRVAKAFNTVPAAMLAEPTVAAQQVTVPVAGDDPGAKSVAADLAHLLGFEPVDAGAMAQAGALESLAGLLSSISTRHGLAGRVGFQLARAGAAGGMDRAREGFSPSPMR